MVKEKGIFTKKWTITKYKNDEDFEANKPYEVSEFEENVLLNEGIAVVLDLIGGIGSPTAYDNANASLGVGNGTDAESASQTGLQGGSTAFQGVEAGYPSVDGQTITWRAIFDGDTANFSWDEFTVVNGADDTGDNLNRKVEDQGTKASGQTWTLDLEITLS